MNGKKSKPYVTSYSQHHKILYRFIARDRVCNPAIAFGEFCRIAGLTLDICLISALAVYEITEEIPRQHWIAVTHKTSIERGEAFKIVRFRNMELGKTIIDLNGVNLPIFDRERTIIDSFRLLSKETAIKALKMALSKREGERLDLIKLQIYAKKIRFNIDPYLLTATT